MIRTLAIATVLGALAGPGLLGGCTQRPPAGAQANLLSTVTPMRFRRLRSMLDGALALARAGDMARVRAGSAGLSREGMALIQGTMPHDVARQDVPRYLEGRARFGEALKAWVTALEGGSDGDVAHALRGLDDAARGWVDAYLGRAPETSV
ncbi:MAG: hypothetical protein O2894_04325 [Planctomycetota bacterium]|nr:hypothetical protein [Planctomycetota bacterium]